MYSDKKIDKIKSVCRPPTTTNYIYNSQNRQLSSKSFSSLRIFPSSHFETNYFPIFGYLFNCDYYLIENEKCYNENFSSTMNTHLRAFTCIWVYVCIFVYMYVHVVGTCGYVCVYMYMYICMHVYTHVCMHICMYMQYVCMYAI